jgi:hypothetical protein
LEYVQQQEVEGIAGVQYAMGASV